jgi:paraquat-inducible protein B
VQTVKLSENYTKVVVTAKIDKSAEGLIVDDAKFWIELPRVSFSGVSGISTVLSGNHIGLETLNRTLKDADKMLNHIDNEMVPEIKTAVQELRKTLAAAERTLKSADNTLVGKDSPTQQELRVALQEVARAARSISALVDYLERNPNALIRGKAQEVPQ